MTMAREGHAVKMGRWLTSIKFALATTRNQGGSVTYEDRCEDSTLAKDSADRASHNKILPRLDAEDRRSLDIGCPRAVGGRQQAILSVLVG